MQMKKNSRKQLISSTYQPQLLSLIHQVSIKEYNLFTW